jgi:hypothetical protein
MRGKVLLYSTSKRASEQSSICFIGPQQTSLSISIDNQVGPFFLRAIDWVIETNLLVFYFLRGQRNLILRCLLPKAPSQLPQ